MIEVISRSFGISGRKEPSTYNKDNREAINADSQRKKELAQDKDLFEMARGIAFRARKRRIRASRII